MSSLSRTITGLAVVAICIILVSCTQDDTEFFTIRVSGPPETSFTGQCSAIDSDQTTIGVTLEGVLTAEQDAIEFEAIGERIYCTLYAEELDGALELELLRDGEVLDSAQTSQAFQDIAVEYPAESSMEG